MSVEPVGHQPYLSQRREVLSLFTGAGGLDLGIEEAGFTNVGCVEIDPDARATLKANRSWKLADPGDVLEWDPEDLLDHFGVKEQGLSLLASGPPCQPWSKAGWWGRDLPRLDDPRAQTLRALMHLVHCALPEVVLIENVRGIAYAHNDDGVRFIRSELDRTNADRGSSYRLQLLPINAADYGVPQRRERLLLLAVRDGSQISLPPPTHVDGDLKLARVSTAWDAIHAVSGDDTDDLAPSGKWADLLPSIPEGENYLWHTERGGGMPLFGWRRRYWSFLLKLARDRPSWTLSASPGPATGPFHWDNRRLGREEMCRLQTFPAAYSVTGSYIAATRQIGNAVPAALGELIGLEIRRQIHGERVRKKLRLIPAQAATSPVASLPSDVPDCFLSLRGTQSPHPGPGEGPGAAQRKARTMAAAEAARQAREFAEEAA